MNDFPPADFPFAIVGFDLDGTLVDSLPDLATAVDHALASIGRPPVPPQETRDLVGGGSRRMLERALDRTGEPLPAGEFEPLYAKLLAHYEDHIADATLPYEGCLDALRALSARGVKLAVVTNKNEHLARLLLGRLEMAHLFACILGGNSLGKGRAKPKRDMIDEAVRRCDGQGAGRFAMVGNSTFDVGAARNAGVPVVAVSFGYADVPVAELGADVLIDSYGDLLPALEKL